MVTIEKLYEDLEATFSKASVLYGCKNTDELMNNFDPALFVNHFKTSPFLSGVVSSAFLASNEANKAYRRLCNAVSVEKGHEEEEILNEVRKQIDPNSNKKIYIKYDSKKGMVTGSEYIVGKSSSLISAEELIFHPVKKGKFIDLEDKINSANDKRMALLERYRSLEKYTDCYLDSADKREVYKLYFYGEAS